MITSINDSNIITVMNITGMTGEKVLSLVMTGSPKVLLHANDKWAICRADLVEPLIENLINILEG